MANYTILLIDYEPRSIERFRQPLSDAGYTVEIATDGLTGIEAFHRLSPDMVLVEAMIPKKHGFEVCQELKRTAHGRKTPVLITTGVYKGRAERRLSRSTGDEYIGADRSEFWPSSVFTTAVATVSVPESQSAGTAGAAAIGTSDDKRASAAVWTKSVVARPTLTKASPTSLADDFTEEEIAARLTRPPGGDFAATSGQSHRSLWSPRRELPRSSDSHGRR
jgi:CheY-like chemotaxis protein